MHRVFPLFSLKSGEVATHAALKEGLKSINGHICPHLRTGSSGLFHGQELTAECTHGPSGPSSSEFRDCGDQRFHFEGRKDTQLCVLWSECPAPGCLTRYGLRRLRTFLRDPLVDFVILEVKRTMLSGPAHASWRAQVVRDGSTEEKIATHKRRSGIPVDCTGQTTSCNAPFCAGKYNGRFLTSVCDEGNIWR
jgi:hypothetical protein